MYIIMYQQFNVWQSWKPLEYDTTLFVAPLTVSCSCFLLFLLLLWLLYQALTWLLSHCTPCLTVNQLTPYLFFLSRIKTMCPWQPICTMTPIYAPKRSFCISNMEAFHQRWNFLKCPIVLYASQSSQVQIIFWTCLATKYGVSCCYSKLVLNITIGLHFTFCWFPYDLNWSKQ